jgi:multidrug resistance efflux pump
MAAITGPPPKSRRWWLIVVALLGVSLAGFAQIMNFSLRGQPTESAADLGEKRFVVCLGLVDLENGVTKMRSLQPGRVAEILVHEGDTVAANAPLLRMTDDLPRAQARQAQLKLESATADLAEARVKLPAKHRLDLDNAAFAVTLAKSARDARQIAYDYKKKGAEAATGVATATDVQLAKKELDAAQTQVQVAETNVQQLQLRDPQSEIRRLEAQVAELAALFEQAQSVLAEYTLTTRRAGSVLRILVSPGDAVGPTAPTPAIEFGIEGPRIVRAEVEQAFAGKLAVGLPVSIEDGANASNQRWTGRVQRIGDWFTHKRNIIADPGQVNDVQTLECIIALDPGQPVLRINQQVIVKIQVP